MQQETRQLISVNTVDLIWDIIWEYYFLLSIKSNRSCIVAGLGIEAVMSD